MTHFSWWLFFLYLSKGGDFVSTELLLIQPDFREANPLMQEFSLRASSTVLAPLAIEGLARYAESKKRPKVALVVRISAIVAWSWLTAHNLRKLGGSS